MKKYLKKKRKHGFTMIEVLVVMTIIGVFSTAGVIGYQSTQTKARDAERKGDLSAIKIALENYYNDFECYPDDTSTLLSQCGEPFYTYLDSVPCDPVSGQPYNYVPLANECQGYRLYAALENTNDGDIEKLGCDGDQACGHGSEYNYGVAAGVTVYDPDGAGAGGEGSPSPSPSPSGPVYVYACDSAGVCNQYQQGHPTLYTCPVTYEQSNCNNECNIPAVRCSN